MTTVTDTTTARDWRIADCPDRASIRVTGFTADAVIADQVVSTLDGMNGVALLTALAGKPPEWVETLGSFRAFLADVAEHCPDAPRTQVEDALWILSRPLLNRVKRAQRTEHNPPEHNLVLLALSYDRHVAVRHRTAQQMSQYGEQHQRALLRLASDVDQIAYAVLAGPAALEDHGIAEALARNSSASLRREVARRVGLRSPVARILSVDAAESVRSVIDQRLHDPAHPDYDDFQGRVIVQ